MPSHPGRSESLWTALFVLIQVALVVSLLVDLLAQGAAAWHAMFAAAGG